ncbi:MULTISPECIES: dephospho-CoA kinase [Streptococcus]|uniref:dephospho-CoA kinase n=1 Tax=Streptococcus TaxID=1301 RepID=UPI001CBCBA93|nr:MULTISPECIES: dephospho-CoA kinase [Streptococcus]MBZ2022483.1 dephospho-CoA kinase [Streptococcus sanguinis]MBZ2047181.1 dephospho-CoA kinase [Streptococcus sanguinis]MBZ2058750.1 dephospho-CoA kinase [Streptococcus sanguinis]MCC3177948.1 dephospho-CoA kinase [Streptococcus sanguinis]MCY7020460.1 dephospho-CoA kinase [Streptococcus sanguinis]
MARIIGITGGIASGKSTVTEFLRQQGYQVIDADQVVHELQEPGGRLYQALLSTFGSSILQEDGRLDRPKLGAMIFGNPELLEQSSQIQNQIIREELAGRRDLLAETEDIFFMDLPLLFELQYEDWFEQIWLVDVTEETQLSRLMTRNSLSQEEAEKRIAAQLSLQEKRKRADVLIDNNGSLEETRQQLRDALQKLERR